MDGSIPDIDKHAGIDKLKLMARKLRVENPGAMYHVMNRGDRRGAIGDGKAGLCQSSLVSATERKANV